MSNTVVESPAQVVLHGHILEAQSERGTLMVNLKEVVCVGYVEFDVLTKVTLVAEGRAIEINIKKDRYVADGILRAWRAYSI